MDKKIFLIFLSLISIGQSYPKFLTNYEMCLKNYLTGVLEGNQEEIPDCADSKVAFEKIIEDVYQYTRGNLMTSIPDVDRVNCLMSILEERKFLETSILFSFTTDERQKKEFLRQLENSLTISVLKCAEPGNLIMEFFEDLSAKLKVNNTTAKCVEEKLTQIVSNEEIVAAETQEFIENYETTTDFVQFTPDESAKIDCNKTLEEFNVEIFKFNYTSLSEEENECVGETFLQDEEAIYGFYAFVHLKINNLDSFKKMNEKVLFKDFLVKLVLAVARCANLLNF